MASDTRFRFTPNVVVGIAMTAAGTVLMLDTLEIVNARDAVRFWPVLLVMFGLSVVVQAFQGGPDAEPGRRPRPIVTPGLVIFLVVIGLLVSNSMQRLQPRSAGRTGAQSDSVIAVMSHANRASNARTFSGADMTSVMGNSRLDLREAMLAPGEEAVVNVFGMMGGLDLVVPEGWIVDVEAVPVMGRVQDLRWRTDAAPDTPNTAEEERSGDRPAEVAAGPPPRVVVRGFIMMGRLSIRS